MTLEIQKKWKNLIENDTKEVFNFSKSEEFDKIKGSTTSASIFVQQYWVQDFNDILFSFSSSVLKNSFFISDLIQSNQFDHDKHFLLVEPFLSDSLFIMKALEKGQDFYQYAQDDAKQDYEVALKAIKHNGRNFKFLPLEYKNLDEFKFLACENEKNCGFQDLELADRNNPVYYNIAKKIPESYQFFSDNLKVKFKKMIVKNPLLLQYAPEQVKSDDKLIYEMLKDKPFSILYAPDKFKQDKELCYSLFLNDKNVINSFDKELFKDIEFCKRIINHNISNLSAINLFSLLPIELQKNNDFLMDFSLKNPTILKYITPDISQNIKFLQLAQSKHVSTFKEISVEYKKDNLLLMKALCTVIINKKVKKDTDFFGVKPKDFIASFPMEKYKNISEHLTSLNPTTFRPIYDVLSAAILEESLDSNLGKKDTKPTLIKI